MPAPLILVLPGGGYSRVVTEKEGTPTVAWLRSLGWRAEVVEYPVGVRHPAPLRFVEERIAAERAAGTDVIGVMGFSAGGHLAGHVALAGTARPDFAVLCYPVVSMLLDTHRPSQDELLGASASDEQRRAVSLEHLVTPDAPPFFVWHTGGDQLVSVEHAHLLGAALAQHGVPHDLHVFAEGPHGLGFAVGRPAAAWKGLCEAWLEKWR